MDTSLSAPLPRRSGASPLGLSWGLLTDPAVRYGIKFGVAGILAVFIALYLRLENPTWALFTVYVLMIAQYVGAIGEKSFFRMLGTLIGGLLGYVMTAGLEQQPFLFLPAIGLVVAFSTAMFGQSRYPYAFFLCGLTTVVVTSNGLGDPDFSWHYTLWRVEEVGVGIFATVLIQSVLWPRFAQREFQTNMHAAFKDLKDCFAASAEIFLGQQNTAATVRAEDFPARISGLRGLLDFGARESHLFRRKLASYFEITTSLSRIAAAIVTLGDSLPSDSTYRTLLAAEVAAVHEAIKDALDGFARYEEIPGARAQRRRRLDETFLRLEEKLAEFRGHPEIHAVAAENFMKLGLHCLALDDIRMEIVRVESLIERIHSLGEDDVSEIEPFVSPIPPPFWIRSGIKAGIAVMAALLIDNWLNPPGGTMFVLGAWVFTALNATSPAGHGDRRAFHYLIYTAIVMLALTMILIAARPLLSSYAVMNTLIFTWLFVWGYLSYTIKGVTIPMQMAMLVSVSILGLNGQKPISFQAMVGFFFGIVLAQLLAAVLQRLIWPSLPQWELRDKMVEFLKLCRTIVDRGPGSIPLWQRARLALIPGEAAVRVGLLSEGLCPEGEQARFTAYFQTLQRTASHLASTIGQLEGLLPPDHLDQGKAMITRLQLLYAHTLKTHEESMAKSATLEDDVSDLQSALEDWLKWTVQIREWTLAHNHPVLESLRILGFASRYHRAGLELITATRQAAQLRMPLYMGDYVL